MPLEHRAHEAGHGPKVALAHAAFGDPVTGIMVTNAPGSSERIRPAGVYSTAPYVPEGLTQMPPKERKVKQLCAFPDKPCRAYATQTTYCVFHNQTMRARGELE
jgi:hypothetical protein